ncbi:MAG: nitroreductase family protein [Methanomassiliicoccales archaeon]|jgi:nitroreductase
MNETMELIHKRRSTRVPFDPDHPVAEEDLRQILEAGRWSPTPHNMQNFEILVVRDKKTIERLGKIESRVTETFLRENYEQLSFSKEELMKKKTGILAAGFPAEMRDPSEFQKVAREGTSMPLRYAIDGSPALLIVFYDTRKRAPDSEGDVLGLVSLGCLMENMWLMATSLGISVRVLSDFGDRDVEGKAKTALDIPDHMKVVYALRLGYPRTEPRQDLRVRREIDDFTYSDRYGNKGAGT